MKDKKRTLDIRTIKQIPVPKFTKSDRKQIIQIVHCLEKENGNYEKIEKLNEIINNAFKLKDEEKEILEKYWKNEPKVDANNLEIGDKWTLTGNVKKVDSKNLEIEVEFYSLDLTKTIRMQGNMPGWLLEEGTEFSCTISNEDMDNIKEREIQLYDITPINYSYMSLEELYVEHDKIMEKEAKYE